MSDWANRQKQALASVSAEPEMKRATGGGGEIKNFYRFTEPKKEGSLQLKAGDTIEGTYQGSPKDKTYGKYFHKIQTANGLIALPSAGQLDKAILSVAEGAKVKVVYHGKKTITTGKYAGKPAHSFDVFASAFKDQE